MRRAGITTVFRAGSVAGRRDRQDGKRLVDHARAVLHERRQVVGRPGGRRNIVEPGDQHILGNAHAKRLAQRVDRADGKQVVGAEQRLAVCLAPANMSSAAANPPS